MFPFLLELLTCAAERKLPTRFYDSLEVIERQRKHLLRLVAEGKKIYAVTTLPGHRDDEPVSAESVQEFQYELIDNHHLPSDSFFGEFASVCVAYTKAHHCALGYTGISTELYLLLLDALQEENWHPKIPRDASYSSGDVIPGAHFAKSLLEFGHTKSEHYELKAKEGITLINGAFVHLGVAISICPNLRFHWLLSLSSALVNAEMCQANGSNLNSPLTTSAQDIIHTFSRLPYPDNQWPVQDPVSLRCLPQVYSAVYYSFRTFYASLERGLHRPSDNPLIDERSEEALSQGGFVLPEISLAASQLADAILMLSWQVCERTNYLLSGKAPGIPRDMATSSSPLGIIQVPKLMRAELDRLRALLGSRVFTSGGNTSGGTEDFWTFGLRTIGQIEAGLTIANRLLFLERAALLYVEKHTELSIKDYRIFADPPAADSFSEVYASIKKLAPTEWKALMENWELPDPLQP